MGKKISCLLIVSGIFLLSISLLLVLRNQQEASEAEVSAQNALESLQTMMETIPTETIPPTPPEKSTAAAEETEPKPMTEKQVNGYHYIGYLSIPDLDLELPVLSQWSYDNLRISPCRHQGTVAGNDLVIAAHNYPQHFGNLKTLSPGSALEFTDMDGAVTAYTIGTVETVDPSREAYVLDSDWDLVLYTCTIGGAQRIMVGASRS